MHEVEDIFYLHVPERLWVLMRADRKSGGGRQIYQWVGREKERGEDLQDYPLLRFMIVIPYTFPWELQINQFKIHIHTQREKLIYMILVLTIRFFIAVVCVFFLIISLLLPSPVIGPSVCCYPICIHVFTSFSSPL